MDSRKDEMMTGAWSHWQEVYGSKSPTEVSWFQERSEVSLALIAATGLPAEAAIIDVGGGAWTLVDHLLGAGYRLLTILDISEAALQYAQDRLGQKAEPVEWVVADVTRWRPTSLFDLWHDRAVLHFLTARDDQQVYFDRLRAAVRPGGWAIIAGFAPGGPQKCSGLEIVQHDADSLGELLGTGFRLIEVRGELHHTPWGAGQAFRYHLFQRD